MPTRRHFLRTTASLLAATTLPLRAATILPAWQPGHLEIHHIDTGRGNSTFVLYPEGTTLLIDAGEAHSNPATMPLPLPDATRRAGEQIARYVGRQLLRANRTELDLVLTTHLHADHVGQFLPASPLSTLGDYRLTGLADVAQRIPIRTLIDRGWPNYTFPAPLTDPSSINYVALARSLAKRGTRIEQASAGSLTQLAPRREPARYPLIVSILSVNGQVAFKQGNIPKSLFDGHTPLATENMCCIALRLEYGAFRYYTGGDLTGDTDYGTNLWRDIETPVAQACGPVSVAVANHHGYFDANNPEVVRALRPRVWIIPAWHVSHPAMGVLASLLSTDLYPGERNVFALGMTPEALLVNERFAPRLSSTRGHIVVRVPPEGRTFTIDIVDAHDEIGTILNTFGPLQS